MSHLLFNIIFPILVAVMVGHVAFVVGKLVLDLLKINFLEKGILINSISMLVGYGIVAYFSLFLSLVGPLNKIVIYLVFASVIVFGRRLIFSLHKQIYSGIKNWYSQGVFEKCLIILIAFSFIFYLTSALVPPYRTDALGYHLPEVKEITEHGIRVLWVEGNFFSNLPILMETFYALLYEISGYTTINLAHYSILLTALLSIYGFIRYYFSHRAGLISILCVFSLYELFVNATNSYVDAAMLSYEIVGLFLLLFWMQTKERSLLILAGIFYGLSISIKYNGLYGLLIAGSLIILFSLFNKMSFKEAVKSVLYFSLPVLVFSSFWYVKNLVLYGNPVYPFYFGHPGFLEQEYSELSQTVKLFVVQKNLINFLLVPFTFFKSVYYLLVFPAFLAWPFGLLWFKGKDEKASLFWKYIYFYILIYLLIWFFIATHQIRFAMVPLVLLLVLLGVQVDKWLGWLMAKKFFSRAILKIVLVVLLLLVVVVGYKIITLKDNYFLKVKKVELGYISGIYDKGDFYEQRDLGVIFKSSNYINNIYRNEKFLNVWKSSNFFLEEGNTFVSSDILYYESEINAYILTEYLKTKNIKYAIIDSYERKQAFTEPVRINNPASVRFANFSLEIEKIVKQIGDKIFDQDGGEIYKFNF